MGHGNKIPTLKKREKPNPGIVKVRIAKELGFKTEIELPKKYKVICSNCEKPILYDNLLGYYCEECGQLIKIELIDKNTA